MKKKRKLNRKTYYFYDEPIGVALCFGAFKYILTWFLSRHPKKLVKCVDIPMSFIFAWLERTHDDAVAKDLNGKCEGLKGCNPSREARRLLEHYINKLDLLEKLKMEHEKLVYSQQRLCNMEKFD